MIITPSLRPTKALALILASCLSCVWGEGESQPEPPPFSALNLLPTGSMLTQVIRPEFDQEDRKRSLFIAKELEVIDKENIEARDVTITSYDESENEVFSVQMKKATYTIPLQILEAQEAIQIEGDMMRASGSGAIIGHLQQALYLYGPVESSFFHVPKKTTSHSSMSPTFWSFITIPLLSIPPAAPTAKEITRVAEQAKPQTEVITKAAKEIETTIAENQKAEEAVRENLNQFAEKSGKPELVQQPSPAVTPKPAPAKPKQSSKKVADIHITCQGGMFFDSEAGHVVYQSNVKLLKKELTLTCQDELKIFLEKKVKAKKGDTLSGIGEVSFMLATGKAKVVLQTEKRGPVLVSAETIRYDAKSQEILLQGGYPLLRQGDDYVLAKEPGLSMKIYADGSFRTVPGKWDTSLSNLDSINAE